MRARGRQSEFDGRNFSLMPPGKDMGIIMGTVEKCFFLNEYRK